MAEGGKDNTDELLIAGILAAVLIGGMLGGGRGQDQTTVSAADDAQAWVEYWDHQCTVQGVVSGDILLCNDSTAVRLIGIDAPEAGYGEIGATSARALLEMAGPGAVVRLELDQRAEDDRGRVHAYVLDGDQRLINERMLAEGYAVAVKQPPNLARQEQLELAAQRAREGRRGLWGNAMFRCFASGKSSSECKGR